VDTPTAAASLLCLTLPAATLGYAFACWVWPFKPCPRCHGSGKRRSPAGRAFRLCRRCEGTGRRLRVGRWLYNHFHRIRRDAR
jgi:hypothetical protein